MEEQYPKQALDKFRQWHFWWLVVFSVLLIVTFVYYLPARFLNQLSVNHHMMEDMHDEEIDEHADEHMDEFSEEEMMKDNHGDSENHGEYVYHEEGDVKNGPVVNLKAYPEPFNTSEMLWLDFAVNTKPESTPVSYQDLQITSEKLMHVIGVRSDMNEFFHVHPRINGDVFTIGTQLKKPGRYKIWSEIKKDDVIHVFGHPQINITGSGATEEKEVSFGRNVILGPYQISLDHNEPIAVGENELFFSIKTLTGGGVELGSYLGEPMHLTIIKDDLKNLIHTHPSSHEADHSFYLIKQAKAHGEIEDGHEVPQEVLEFVVNFPEPGLYKAFAQFLPAEFENEEGEPEPFLAEFWLEVKGGKEADLPAGGAKTQDPWWALLVVSVVLIVILSLVVKKYITVK